ncbi:hypothetical protein HMSSN139_26410 [Paenibacillus sp. HMSSN-139]|nr:hypothetical protein HMSSN139_26410 [Paenibacillus sp. HMSSN-139]
MFKNVYNWIDERLDITPIWRDVADHEVPEHVNPAHHFFRVCVLLRRLDVFYHGHPDLVGDVPDHVLRSRYY